jgi:hypothetical protein
MQHEFQMGGTRVLYIAKTDIYFHVWRILFWTFSCRSSSEGKFVSVIK